MPAVLALPAFWGAVSAGVGGAAGIYGAHKVSQSTDKATAASIAGNNAAIAEQQRQDAEQKRQFDAQQSASKAQWDAQQQNLAPYRAASASALSSLGDLLGTHFDVPASPSQPSSSGSSGGDTTVPPAPSDLTSALQAANKIAYGGTAKHTDPSYWQSLWQQDPAYAWKRMLGWQAGGSDAATSGPYAGQSSAAPKSAASSSGMTSLAPFMTPSNTPATNATYAPVIPISQVMRY